MLMLVGIYGLILEGYNPGAIVPGVVGAICMLLALYAFQVLPVNYAGLGLIILGIILMIAEGFAPSFGALGMGGVAAFVFGSVILLDSGVPGFSISPGIIGSVAFVASAAMLGLIYLLLKYQRRTPVSGAEGMVGQTAEVLADIDGHGTVFLHGERWEAHSKTPVTKGNYVRVRAIRGLILDVEPTDPPD